MKWLLEKSSKYLYYLLFVSVLFSCVPQKKLKYARKTKYSKDIYENVRTQKPIRPFDELYIKILSIDEKTAQIFYNPNDLRLTNNMNLISYLVNENGDINFPFIGNINLKGLSLDEAGEKLQTSLDEYLPDTEVIVKFVNNHITVLGEVERQGEFIFTNDKITVFQALGLAGGISRYGKREEVILIREIEDKINYFTLDLTEREIVQSPYYYLLPDDVLIVEPLRAKSWSYQNVTYTTMLTSITTFIAILLTIRQFYSV
ncbi:MAG: polysaccharide biosynthesis/export family protein [Bacteroidota bacterium]